MTFLQKLMAAIFFFLIGAAAWGQTVWYIANTNDPIYGPLASDSNNGLSPATPWATFYNINFLTHGSHSFSGANIFLCRGMWNGGGGLSNSINNPVTYGATNQVMTFTNWGPNPWGITNDSANPAIRISSQNWIKLTGFYLYGNGYGIYGTGCYNIEIGNGTFNGTGLVGSSLFMLGNCNSNYYHDLTLMNAGAFDNFDGSDHCRDGGTGLMTLGTYASPTDFANYDIIERCYFSGFGHHGLSLSGVSNYIQNCTWTNPAYYMATWCGAGTIGNTPLTGSTWWGGREVDAGGYSSGWNVYQSNTFAYSGYVPDMPGALQLEGEHNDGVRYNSFFGNACQALSIYGNGQVGPDGSNYVYNNSIMGSGSNATWYTANNALVYVSYPEYSRPIFCANTSNNFFVNNITFHNQSNDWNFLDGAGTDVQEARGNITNTDPFWVSLQNSVADLVTVTGDPLLMPNLSLQVGSPAIGTGQPLAWISSASGTGTTFTVTNSPYYFFTGVTACNHYIPPDTIWIVGTFQSAQIASITGNTITTATPLTWVSGQGLALSPSPNVGAFGGPSLVFNGTGSANLILNGTGTAPLNLNGH